MGKPGGETVGDFLKAIATHRPQWIARLQNPTDTVACVAAALLILEHLGIERTTMSIGHAALEIQAWRHANANDAAGLTAHIQSILKPRLRWRIRRGRGRWVPA